MSKYIIEGETFLFFNQGIYVLVREEEVSKNDPCLKCSLFCGCHQPVGIYAFRGLCTPDEDDERWFFKDIFWQSEETQKEATDAIQDIINAYI